MVPRSLQKLGDNSFLNDPLCPQLSLLPCWPIGLAISFLGLSRLIYSVFTSYSSHRPAGCHSCHVGPLGLLFSLWASPAPLLCRYLLFLPWTSCHSCHIDPFGLLTSFFLPLPLLLNFFCYWAFIKNGHQHWVPNNITTNISNPK